MANFHFSADLMQYIGAQYISAKARPRKEGETDEQYAKVPVVSGIFIPDKYNGIEVQADNSDPKYRTKSGLTAKANFSMYAMRLGNNQDGTPTFDQKTVNTFSSRLLQNGEQPDAYNVPSHRINISMKEEHIIKLRAMYQNKVLAEHPEWAGTTEETNAELRKEITKCIPNNVGLAFLNRPKKQENAAPQYAQPAPMLEAQPAFPEPANNPFGGEVPVTDLPF